MGKGKRPRKRTPPSTEPASVEKALEPQTQEKAELVPLPERHRPSRVPEREGSLLTSLVEAVQLAVGALLDLADTAAEIITKQIERRA